MSKRTMVYIDGFNLYFGMRDSGWKRYYWMDIGRFGRGLATGDREVVGVKYFTARVAAPPDQVRRQVTFLEANQIVGGSTMYFGRYQQDPYQCRHCGTRSVASHEKATDVFLAVELLTDAVSNTFDGAILVSADADYAPVIRRVRELFPEKFIVVGQPPRRMSSELQRTANGSFRISEEMLRRSQLPEAVTKPDGFVLRRPSRWSKNVPPRPYPRD
jgi:uncharacterized LabA/DUF88 family protein